MAPAVSVIVPVYNVECYLERCLDSILGQSFRDFELILVDDGSDDRSPAICEEYRRRDGRVQVIHQENAGAGLARNSGLDVARGEFVAFVDADDYWREGLLEALYSAAEGVDCVAAGMTIIYARGGMVAMPLVDQKTIFEGDETAAFLLGSMSALPESRSDSPYGQTSCGKLYRRQLIAEKGIRFCSEREYVSEDTLFNIDFLRCAKRVIALPGAWYCYDCTHRGSLSKGYRDDRFARELTMQPALEKRLSAILPRERYILYLQRFFIMCTAFIITQEVLYHDHVDSAHPMRANIRRILADDTLREYLREYPWYRLPFLRMVLVGTMRLRFTDLLILLIRIQQRVMKSCQNI